MQLICKKCNETITLDKRTLSQNAYLHLIIGKMANSLGYTHSEMKQLLKHEFGLYTVGFNRLSGKEFTVYKSTKNLTRKDFADFTEKILLLANGSYGMNLLTPEEFFET